MLMPYRTAAKPPKARATPPNRALVHVVRWLPVYAVIIGLLSPAALLPGPQTPEATLFVLFYVLGLILAAWTWPALGPWPQLGRQVDAALLLNALAVLVGTGLFWGSPNTSAYAPLPTARLVLSTRRAEYVHLPYGTYITLNGFRTKLVGFDNVLILRGAVFRCFPGSGPLEEGVVYTPDCEPEAR